MVLLGDLHLYQLGVRPWRLLSKRVLGYANLLLNRRKHFDLSRLPTLLARVEALKPDMILGTGDLTTLATQGEFDMVRDKLGPTFARHDTFIIPGNHDRYTFTAARTRAFERAMGDWTPQRWPAYRLLRPHLHLIAIDQTRPNIITDRGRVGAAQLNGLRQVLDAMTEIDRVIVMGHYPIGMPPGHPPEATRHALIDAEELVRVLCGCAAGVLYLHGHVHEPQVWVHPASDRLAIVNAGAPLYRKTGWLFGQGFWCLDDEGDWPPALTHHELDDMGTWYGSKVIWPDAAGVAAKIG